MDSEVARVVRRTSQATSAATQRAAAHWSDESRRNYYLAGGLTWGQIPAVRRRVNAKISGHADRDWIQHLLDTHLAGSAPVERCVSLCSFDGRLEREMAARGVFEHCVGYDVAEPMVQIARGLAEAEGHTEIEYVCADLNELTLPRASCDLVVARGALHHLVALEHVADSLATGLREGGLLVVNDYLGANRFQHSRRQWDLCDAALTLVPEAYRRSVSWQRSGRVGPGARRSVAVWLRLLWYKLRDGTLASAAWRRLRLALLRSTGGDFVKRRVARVSAEALALDDPTEAVRSQDIVPVLKARFDTLEYTPYGGSILMPVLDDLAGNFPDDDPVAPQVLQMLFEIEDTAMECGETGSDFAFFVARKRATSQP